MKIRIKFRKYGNMKFIGHLDVMRYFQKAIRRADVGIRYSEGFSPHQIMSFAAPLGVGITSEGEYLDIEVVPPEERYDVIRTFLEQSGPAYRQDLAALLHIGDRQCALILKHMVEDGRLVQAGQRYALPLREEADWTR